MSVRTSRGARNLMSSSSAVKLAAGEDIDRGNISHGPSNAFSIARLGKESREVPRTAAVHLVGIVRIVDGWNALTRCRNRARQDYPAGDRNREDRPKFVFHPTLLECRCSKAPQCSAQKVG